MTGERKRGREGKGDGGVGGRNKGKENIWRRKGKEEWGRLGRWRREGEGGKRGEGKGKEKE